MLSTRIRRCTIVNIQRFFSNKPSLNISQYADIAQQNVKSFKLNENGTISARNDTSAFSVDKVTNSMQLAMNHFLPRTYPHSVASGYAQFALGHSMSVALSTISSVLSMQSLLFAIGLSAEAAIPVAAAVNWVLKDGLGQLGGVLFASFVSNKFDANPKKWRFLACVSMDAASFIELLTPLAPAYFLFLASIANIGKNISFLASSASRAAIHKSFALHENLADITVKAGSQSILASMIGTAAGISLSTSLNYHFGQSLMASSAAFLTCSSLSLLCLLYSLKHVTIRTLSPNRLDTIVYDYLAQPIGVPRVVMDPSGYRKNTESKFLHFDNFHKQILIGESLERFINNEVELQKILRIFANRNYLVVVKSSQSTTEIDTIDPKFFEIFVSYDIQANKSDVLRALVFASTVKHEIENGNPRRLSRWELVDEANYNTDTIDKICSDLLEMEGSLTNESTSIKEKVWIVEEMLLETKFNRHKISHTIQ